MERGKPLHETDECDKAHKARMQRLQKARQKLMAKKTVEKCLIVVHSGDGKGKTSAALGMVMRHIGHGLRVGIVQFTKSRKWLTGETLLLAQFPDLVTHEIMGEGFTWDTQDRSADIANARAGWERAKEMMLSGDYRLVLLDELNIVLRYDYLPAEEIVDFLTRQKPDTVHVIITGRNAKPEILAIADLIVEMTNVRHPFTQGVVAQKGIEF